MTGACTVCIPSVARKVSSGVQTMGGQQDQTLCLTDGPGCFLLNRDGQQGSRVMVLGC